MHSILTLLKLLSKHAGFRRSKLSQTMVILLGAMMLCRCKAARDLKQEIDRVLQPGAQFEVPESMKQKLRNLSELAGMVPYNIGTIIERIGRDTLHDMRRADGETVLENINANLKDTIRAGQSFKGAPTEVRKEIFRFGEKVKTFKNADLKRVLRRFCRTVCDRQDEILHWRALAFMKNLTNAIMCGNDVSGDEIKREMGRMLRSPPLSESEKLLYYNGESGLEEKVSEAAPGTSNRSDEGVPAFANPASNRSRSNSAGSAGSAISEPSAASIQSPVRSSASLANNGPEEVPPALPKSIENKILSVLPPAVPIHAQTEIFKKNCGKKGSFKKMMKAAKAAARSPKQQCHENSEEFPNWEDVEPKRVSNQVRISRRFQKAMRAAKRVTNQRRNGIDEI